MTHVRAANLTASRRRSATALWLSLIALGLAFPAGASACPVCFSGLGEASRESYFIGFVIMTLLPFVTIGPVAFWLWRRLSAPSGARLPEPRADGDRALAGARAEGDGVVGRP